MLFRKVITKKSMPKEKTDTGRSYLLKISPKNRVIPLWFIGSWFSRISTSGIKLKTAVDWIAAEATIKSKTIIKLNKFEWIILNKGEYKEWFEPIRSYLLIIDIN